MENTPFGPGFVGRSTELTAIARALSDAEGGRPQAVIVGGEAGVGKTRLVEEFIVRARADGAVAAVGVCVEAGADALPFAPFSWCCAHCGGNTPRNWPPLPAVRRTSWPGSCLSSVGPPSGRTARTGRLGCSSSRPACWSGWRRSARWCSSWRTCTGPIPLRATSWSTWSACRVAAGCWRSGPTAPTVCTGGIRYGPFLASWTGCGRYTASNCLVSTVLRWSGNWPAFLAAPPESALAEEIFARSDGNAFFVEELASSVGSGARLSDSLRGLLLVRAEALPEDARRVVRAAAAGGGEYALLKAVTRMPEDDLIEAMRAAVEGGVLLPSADGDGYRFRHSLVREAVADDLLPGERSRLNRDFAEALEADPSLVRTEEYASRLAGHWYQANDADKALPMILRASVESRRRYAHSEQLWLLERAMELWDTVPAQVRDTLRPRDELDICLPDCGDGSKEPLVYMDVMAEATVAARLSGQYERALSIARTAVDLLATRDDPLTAAWFWSQRSQLVQELMQSDGWTELVQARDIVAGLPPSTVHADILVNIARWGARHRPDAESLADAERAVAFARLVGSEYLELDALLTRGWLTECSAGEDGLADLYDVRARAENLGAPGIIGRVGITLPSWLESVGRSEEAVAAAQYGAEACRAHGLADTEAWIRCNQSLSLFFLGRWEESDHAVAQASGLARTQKSRGLVWLRRAQMALMRGNIDTAQHLLTLSRDAFGTHDPEPQLQLGPVQITMSVAARQGRITDARREFQRSTASGIPLGLERYGLPLLCAAATIEADAQGLPRADDGRAAVLAAIRDLDRQLPPLHPVWRA